MKINFDKMDGLVPAIIQESRGGQVLMLGFMNEEAFHKTLETGKITFFSRTKKRLWTKGESSGNFLKMDSWSKDCDSDSLLFLVKPEGNSCHLGHKSCFADSKAIEGGDRIAFLSRLETIIDSRRRDSQESSYTSQLMRSGIEKIAQKLGEEAVETVIALVGKSGRDLIEESADLIYHLMVGLKMKGLDLSQVTQCLEERHASRQP